MKEITQYLASAIVAGALALGGNAHAKPNSYQGLAESERIIKQAERLKEVENYNINFKKLEYRIQGFEKHKDGLENYVVQRVSDGELSFKELKEIRNYLGESKERINNIHSYSEDNDIRLSEDQRSKLIYDRDLSSQVRNAIDFSGRGLEKYFAKKGISVDVKGWHAFLKAFLVIGIFGLIGGLAAFKFFSDVAKNS